MMRLLCSMNLFWVGTARCDVPARATADRRVATLNVHPPQYCYGGRVARTAQRTVPTMEGIERWN